MPAYKNPIIPGFNPDPSICLVNGIFYLVTSSFLAFPGIPIYASKDLVNWKQIGNVITRDSQIDMSPYLVTIRGESGGVWAPTIRYKNGLFYVIVSCVVQGDDMDWYDPSRFHGFIWTCPDPFTEEWSDPVRFDFPGFDTSLFWDTDGKVYLHGTEAYKDFALRQISQYEIDLKTGKSLSGPPKFLWEGTGGIFPEAPHIFLKDGFYYMLIAEGGTYMEHSGRMARAKNIWGPYEPCPHNPVLRPPPATEYVQTIGHADFVEDFNGNWWAVALGTRILPDHSSPMGREAYLIEGSWPKGDWPTFTQPVKINSFSDRLPTPNPDLGRVSTFEHSGPRSAFTSSESSKSFSLHWIHYRNPNKSKYIITSPRTLTLEPTELDLSARRGSPTFVGIRQLQRHFNASVIITPATNQHGVEAGLTVFLDDIRHAEVYLSGGKVLFRRTTMGCKGVTANVSPLTQEKPLVEHGEKEESYTPGVRIKLLATASEDAHEFIFSYDGGNGPVEMGRVPAIELSVGFCGTIVGLYAVARQEQVLGKPESRVQFSDFEYIDIPKEGY